MSTNGKNNKQNKIVALMRKVAKEEVNKTLKKNVRPIVEKIVESKMNSEIKLMIYETVNQNLMQVIAESMQGQAPAQQSGKQSGKQNLGEVFASQGMTAGAAKNIKYGEQEQPQTDPEKERQVFEERLRNLGVEDDPTARMIFEETDDIETSVPAGGGQNGAYQDDPSEGVDLSQFGF